jgi:hypothetical protein
VTSDWCKPQAFSFFISVPSVFSVLKAFEFLRDSHTVKSFNTEATEGTEKGDLEAAHRPKL